MPQERPTPGEKMSDIPRYRRTDPSRTGPNRHFSNLYRPYNSMNPDQRTAASESPEAERGTDFAMGPRAPGVDSAYRIFAQHMKQRRQTANSFNRGRPYGARYQRGIGDGLQGLMDSYGEIATLLIEMLNRLTPGGGYGGQERRGYEHQPSSGAPTTYVCTSIPLALKTNRVCDVLVELYPFTDLEKLKANDLVLVPEKPAYPNLKGVAKLVSSSHPSTESERSNSSGDGGTPSPMGNTPTLHIDVPSTAASCLYRAEILDERDQPRGTLTLFLG